MKGRVNLSNSKKVNNKEKEEKIKKAVSYTHLLDIKPSIIQNFAKELLLKRRLLSNITYLNAPW